MILDLEYTPGVEWHASGEVTDELASRWKIDKPRPDMSPTIEWGNGLSGVFDRLGRFTDKRPLYVQVGVDARKAGAEWDKRIDAERRRAELEGGEYWFGGESTRSRIRFQNLLWLRRWHLAPTDTNAELEARVLDRWQTLGDASLREILDPLGGKFAKQQLLASGWRTVALVQASRGLRLDLNDFILSLDEPLGPPTGVDGPLRFHTDRPDRTPAPMTGGLWDVPGHLPDLAAVPEQYREKAQTNIDLVLRVVRDKQKPSDFMRTDRLSRADMAASVSDDDIGAKRADPLDRTDRFLEQLVADVKEHGWWKAIPYARRPQPADTDPSLLPAIVIEAARSAYRDPMVRTPTDLMVHALVTDARDALSDGDGERFPFSESEAAFLIARFKHDPHLSRIRSGDTTYRGKMADLAYRLTIPFPGLVQQVDYHREDVVVKVDRGVDVKLRPALMALVDVAYCVPTGWLEVPGEPNTDHYIDLAIQSVDAAEKAELLRRSRVEGEWPSCLAGMIVADWGWIFAATAATEFLIDHLFVILAWGPVRTPAVRGTVETVFRAQTALTHREPASTGSSPWDRRAFDPWKAAKRHGLHWEIFCALNVSSLVTRFLPGWDELRDLKRIDAWNEAAEAFGIPQFLGSRELLRLQATTLVRRGKQEEFRVHPDKTVRAFGAEYSTEEGWISFLVGQLVRLRYRKKDITHLDVYVGSEFKGVVHSRKYDYRVSEWEYRESKSDRTARRDEARGESRESLSSLVQQAKDGAKLSPKDSRRVFLEFAEWVKEHRGPSAEPDATNVSEEQAEPSSPFKAAVRNSVDTVTERLPVTFLDHDDE